MVYALIDFMDHISIICGIMLCIEINISYYTLIFVV